MYSTKNFLYNKEKKMFTTTNDLLPKFDLQFVKEDEGKVIDIESAKSGKVSSWEVENVFFFRSGRPKNLRLVPTKSTLEQFPDLAEHRMFIYYNKERTAKA